MDLVLRDEIENRFGLPAGVEESCFTRNFIPDEVAVDRDVVVGSGNDPKFAPCSKIDVRGKPAASYVFQFCRMEADGRGERTEQRLLGRSS